MQVRNHKGKAVVDFKGIPLEQVAASSKRSPGGKKNSASFSTSSAHPPGDCPVPLLHPCVEETPARDMPALERKDST